MTIVLFSSSSLADYEQQRRDLLHKYGIDLDDGTNLKEGNKTKRLDRREVNRLMGGDNGEGVFTWREKNRKKVRFNTFDYMFPYWNAFHSWLILCKSDVHRKSALT